LFINTGSIFSWDCIYSTLFFIPLILWQQIYMHYVVSVVPVELRKNIWYNTQSLCICLSLCLVRPHNGRIRIGFLLNMQLQYFGRSKCACMHNLSNWLVLKYIVDKTCGFDEETMKNQLLCFYIHAPHCTFNMFSLLKFWYTYCTVSAKEVCQK
jgi:hypothetical protein